jgi:hypothetical protein
MSGIEPEAAAAGRALWFLTLVVARYAASCVAGHAPVGCCDVMRRYSSKEPLSRASGVILRVTDSGPVAPLAVSGRSQLRIQSQSCAMPEVFSWRPS